jgi:hypothetical protein
MFSDSSSKSLLFKASVNSTGEFRAERRHEMFVHWLARSPFAVLLLAVDVTTSTAQPGPPCGSDLPIKCTPGKDAAIVLGFVGAGILAVYLGYRLDHPRHEELIIGCTVQAGGMMALVEDNTQMLYSLTPLLKKVKAGDRLVLRGKKKPVISGRNVFHVKKLVLNEGPCETQSPRAGQDSDND